MTDSAPGLRPQEVTRRAAMGVVSLAGRGALIKVFALFGYLVLAHVLSPREFGTLAIGLAAVGIVEGLMFGGLAAGLIRDPHPPDKADLAALLGVQVFGSAAVAVLAWLTVSWTGSVGLATAIMLSAIPLMSLRLGSAVLAERDLNYGPLVRVDILESLVFFSVAAALAVGPLGLYGVALAAPVRAATGSILLLCLVPGGRVWPRLNHRRARRLMGFGVRFQLVNASSIVRDQLLVVVIGGIGGLGVLGLWTLAQRILQVPYMLLQSLWRVAYPGMARLRDAGADVSSSLQRYTTLLTLVIAVVFSTLASGLTPLVAPLFGEEWADAAEVIPLATSGLILLAPGGVLAAGYLFSEGRAQSVLLAVTLASALWIVVTASTLAAIGVAAVGLGWAVAGLAETVAMARSVKAINPGVHIVRASVPAWLIGLIGIVAGWAVANTMGAGITAACAAVTVSALLQVSLVILFVRRPGREVLRFGGRMLKSVCHEKALVT